ncbi:hypothetical protein ASD67_08120 [Sphingopyxis sp. Root1497]|uniref:MarR family winged helix-turn-helix transcriptional regulator n=1 Tax=Sphingopyxis sp. Root1497 TaxID=1736474 RepID=UPI0006F4B666|nr:MarR family transcriptional regulator [Sphingopyxis sp. Root1497]KQZ64433.1 hypothetical protein ASD67_08120 [Sphingopyxis sp. Root1497]
MEQTEKWFDRIALPALLRHARTTYGAAMRKALDAQGYDDIPGNGLYIIGGLALGAQAVPIGQLAREMRVTKQGMGQLIDTLVMRGYLARTPDAADRRQLMVTLTARGQAAAEVQTAARAAVDQALAAKVGDEDIARTRRTLAALIEIHRAETETADA